MTQSQAVGPFRVRPRLWRGAQTGKWFVDVPASLTSAGKRKRKLFDNQGGAQAAAQRLRDSIDDVAGLLKVRKRNADALFGDAADGWLADEELRVATLKKRAASLMVNGYRLNAARVLRQGAARGDHRTAADRVSGRAFESGAKTRFHQRRHADHSSGPEMGGQTGHD